jgi:hypothetical protein
VAALVIAVLSLLFGLPLRDVAMKFWTDSRRMWVAAHRRVLMIVVGVAGMLVLLIASPLTGRIVLIDLLVVGILLGLIALLSLEPAESVTEELGSDDEQQHGHDHGVVRAHRGLQRVFPTVGKAVAAAEAG